MSLNQQYAATLGDLLLRQGDQQAQNAREQARLGQVKGQLWGNFLGGVAKLIQEAPERDLQQQERTARIAQLGDISAERKARAQQINDTQAGAQALAQAISDPANGNDPERIYQAVAKTHPQQAMTFLKQATEHQTAIDALSKTKDGQHQAFADILSGIDPNDEAALTSAFGLAKVRGIDQGLLDQFAQTLDTMGTDKGIAQIVGTAPGTVASKRAAAAKKAEPYTLNHGDVRYQDGAVVASNPKPVEPPKFKPLDQQYAEATDPAERKRLLGLMSDEAAAKRGPERPTSSAAASGVDELTPEAIEDTATRYRLLGNAGLPTRIGEAAKTKILNAAAKQSKDLGQSPVATIQKQAAMKADTASLQKMQTMSDSAAAFENKALAQTDIIRDLSAKVPRSTLPIINQVLQAGRTEITGNSQATQLANAIETFSEEYAKVMSGSTGSAAAATDSTRSAAKRLINTAMSKGTMADVLDLMSQEMRLTMQGYDATIGHINERMGTGAGNATTPPPRTGGGIPTYQDYLNQRR